MKSINKYKDLYSGAELFSLLSHMVAESENRTKKGNSATSLINGERDFDV